MEKLNISDDVCIVSGCNELTVRALEALRPGRGGVAAQVLTCEVHVEEGKKLLAGRHPRLEITNGSVAWLLQKRRSAQAAERQRQRDEREKKENPPTRTEVTTPPEPTTQKSLTPVEILKNAGIKISRR